MKRNLVALILLQLLPIMATAQTADFSEFRVISQRNIFNLNRVPPRAARTPVAQPPPALVDAFSLVGTMTYEKGQYAFFDGTRPDYQKVLQPTHTIGGYKLVAVLPSSVRLETQGIQFEMKLGMQLRRDETSARLCDDSLSVSDYKSVPSATPMVAPAPSAGPPASASSSEPAPDAGEILKRLMQKREQELK